MATCDCIQIKLLICRAPTRQDGLTDIYGRGLVVASEETDYAFLRLNNFASRQKLLKDGACDTPFTLPFGQEPGNLLLMVFHEQAHFTIISF